MERQINTSPLRVPRSRRKDEWRGLTSGKAGEVIPLAFFPMLREDALRGRIMVQVKMAEALHTIINPIRVVVQAHLVSKIALSRFEGSLETLNRSYMGQTLPGGGAAPKWHIADTAIAALGDDDLGHAIYDKLGVHYKSATKIPTDLVESYWRVINWRRASVSKALAPLPETGSALAAAFWDSWKFDAVKPSFDAALMEGAIELSIQGTMNLGNVWNTQQTPTAAAVSANPAGQPAPAAANQRLLTGSTTSWPEVDMASSSGIMTLANLELAKKTQAFAVLRQRYQGVPDEYLIDLLMQGINVPPEDFREPILIGRQVAVIGQTERYATNYEDLDKSLTNGVCQLSMTLNTPAVNPGGMVLVTAEIVPEQLYERTEDLALTMDASGSADWLPNYLRDELDPQKVEIVPNSFADQFHTDPAGVFGYAPLNHRWQRNFARVGGRFKRPVPDAFVEDRQRIWAVEKADPSLSEDFYLCPQPFPHTVFADTAADPFELIVVGDCAITGLTVFGQGFQEDDDHYEKIMADVDSGRISSDPPTAAADGETAEQTRQAAEVAAIAAGRAAEAAPAAPAGAAAAAPVPAATAAPVASSEGSKK